MKIKLNTSLVLILISSLIFSNSFGQSNNNEFIGDYKNSSNSLFAQVYKNSNGEYKINIVSDLISRRKPNAILSGVLENKNILNINGDGWIGKIEKGKLIAENGKESIVMNSFKRTSPTMNAKPPKEAIVLFNGKNLDSWLKAEPKDWLEGSSPADNWAILPGGILEVTTQPSGEHLSILTKQNFGDLKLHIEFRLLGGKTNGGIYFMSRYELNVKDAYGNVGESPISFGNVSKPKDLYPDVNVAFPPLEWQTFDVDFRAPRFDNTGTNKIENARITVVHNGVTTIKDVEIEELKGATGKLGEAGVGPLYLQDHGNVYQFRNIWVIDKTLKGTEKHKTAISESDDVSEKPNKVKELISEDSAKKKSGGNKSGGNKSGGNKSGGNKSGGNKKTNKSDFDQINKKAGTGKKTSIGTTSDIKKKGSKKTTENKPVIANKDDDKKGVAEKNTSISSTTDIKKKGKKKSTENRLEINNKEDDKKGKDVKTSYVDELNPLYKDVTVSLFSSNTLEANTSSGFQHPGVLVNNNQLSEIKRRIENKIEPQYSAFELLKRSPLAAIDYTATPRDTVSCGPRSRPNLGCKDEQNDSAAAYSQALLWVITGDKIYAENAIKIMNAWSYTLVGGHNYANGPVQAAWSGSIWPRAAEIIRYTYDQWSDLDVLKFQNMLRTQYLPSIIHGDCENGNKELAMCEALVNIGVFLDDKKVFDLGLKIWRGRTPAYIYLKSDGVIPIQPPGCPPAFWGNKGKTPEFVDGLLQETARDSHHIGYAFSSMANTAETARQQGIDLYREEGKRMMAAMEFQAQYLPPNNVPAPENLEFANLPTWEIAFNHFHNRLGLSLPNMSAVMPTNRPTGTNHQMLWETLTHAEIGMIGLPPVIKDQN